MSEGKIRKFIDILFGALFTVAVILVVLGKAHGAETVPADSSNFSLIIGRLFEAMPDLLKLLLLIIPTASLIVSGSKTPDPNTWWGKFYKMIELLAVNFGRVKETGKKK